jgi:hypothetical protein
VDHLAQDISKIHGEILQIGSQRFQLTTAAVVFFAAICSWTTSTVARADVAASEGEAHVAFFTRASAVIAVIVLALLFRYHLSYGKTLRWLSTYLICAGSDWEWHYYVFRRGTTQGKLEHAQRPGAERPFYGYTIGSAYVFLMIILCSVVYFVGLEMAFVGIQSDFWHWWSGIMVTTSAIGLYMFHLATKVDNLDEEKRMLHTWQSIRESCTPRQPVTSSVNQDNTAQQ